MIVHLKFLVICGEPTERGQSGCICACRATDWKKVDGTIDFWLQVVIFLNDDNPAACATGLVGKLMVP